MKNKFENFPKMFRHFPTTFPTFFDRRKMSENVEVAYGEPLIHTLCSYIPHKTPETSEHLKVLASTLRELTGCV